MVNTRRNKHMYCKTQPMLDVKMVSSKDVDNGLVQDRSKPIIIIGSDVVSLYPNLMSKESGEEIYQAVVDSDTNGTAWPTQMKVKKRLDSLESHPARRRKRTK